MTDLFVNTTWLAELEDRKHIEQDFEGFRPRRAL